MTVDPRELYGFDNDEYTVWLSSDEMHPLRRPPRQYTTTYVAPCALLRILKHGLSSNKEIMGFAYGRAFTTTFYILDVHSLAVEGTETRVGVTDESFEAMWAYQEAMISLSRHQRCVCWYHSHPGLHCYLSGIDVRNDRLAQSQYIAMTALVVDPIETAHSGKIHLGSYCTFPPKKAADGTELPDDDIPIPPDVHAKYGSAANSYYELDLKYYCTPTDKKVISDLVTRSYGVSIATSILHAGANYIGKQIQEAAVQFGRLNSDQPDPLPQLARTLNQVNQDRKTGIWLHRMKCKAFG
jgi:proteasome lid subunit RPN8/RPN11